MYSEIINHFVLLVEEEKNPLPPQNTQSLVAAAKSGDINAFEAILVRYQRQVLSMAIRLLNNMDDAHDAAQEVFLRLHKYLYRFNEEKEFSPWLSRMTINACHDIARKRKPLLSLEQECEKGHIAALATTQNVENEFTITQEHKILAEALATLSEKERAAIVLRDMEGRDTAEVARLLGSSEATVRSQISMARLKIKKYRDKVLNRAHTIKNIEE
jgi:RNA polymerase sigma-70 factor (ECF subfamily)